MLTILISTRNRPEFLKRLLNYFKSVNCPYPILVGDASDNQQGFIDCRGLHYAATIKKLLEQVHTPYVVQCPDDDFIIPGNLARCVEFLENRYDYVAAHGKGLVFGSGVSTYKQPVLTSGSPVARLKAHLRHYSVSLFSVVRTVAAREMFHSLNPVDDEAIRGEILPGCLLAIQGKIKDFDFLTLIRQVHPGRKVLIKEPDSDSYYTFIYTLAIELTPIDNIDFLGAEELIKKLYWEYRDKRVSLIEKMQRRFSQIKLKDLLNPQHKFHKDFMPVYRSLAGVDLGQPKVETSH